MKIWLFRFSIARNLLIVIVALGAWCNKEVFIRAFLTELYAAKISFFDGFPLHTGDVVMLGDSRLWQSLLEPTMSRYKSPP